MRKAASFALAVCAVPLLLAAAGLLWTAERIRGPLPGGR